MDNRDQITEQYLHGNEELQLYLFLSHPTLRHRFMEISSLKDRSGQVPRRLNPLRRWVEQISRLLTV